MNDIELIVHFLLSFIVLLLVIAVNKKLYSNIKKEEHQDKGKVIQTIIKAYSIAQCIAYPFLFGFQGIIVLNNLVFELVRPSKARYFVSILKFLTNLATNYLSFHSLIIAICRYVFIVFETKAEAVGIKKLRNIFISSSVIIPFLSTILLELSNPLDEAYLAQLAFNKTHLQIELSESSIYPNADLTTNAYESPIFLFAQKYCPSGLIQALHVIDLIVAITIYSNIVEALIYTHMHIFCNR